MFSTSVAVCRLSRKELVSHKKHKNTAEHELACHASRDENYGLVPGE